MDAVMSKMIGKAIEGYFSVFFKNFRKEDFRLNMGASETMTTLHNLEINHEVVQELFGNPNLEVGEVSINTLSVKVKPTKINKRPIVIHIDRVTCKLFEPYSNLKPLPTVLEEFFRRFVQKDGKSSYGFVEKIIDGVSLEIDEVFCEVLTRGKYKTPEPGVWTPPKVVVEVRNILCQTTNDRWEVVDLNVARDYNKDLPEIFVFRTMSIGSVNVELHDHKGERIVPLITNLEVSMNVTLKKKLDNQIAGLSIHMRINQLQMLVKIPDLVMLHAFVTGLSGAMNRRDSPNPSKTQIPHEAIYAHVEVRELSMVVVEPKSGLGIEVVGRGMECGMAWPEKMPHYEKCVELCMPFLGIREFSSRSGPGTQWLVQPDANVQGQNPFTSIPPLVQSLHPKYTVTSYDTPPMFYVKAINRFPPKKPLFDREMQAILNPVLVTITPESIATLLEFAVASSPYLSELQAAQEVKPEGDLSGILVQGAKTMLEDLMTLKVDVQNIAVSFPSDQGGNNHMCLNIKEACLLSHPQLPESELLTTGICALTTLPGDASDFVHSRAAVRASAMHSVKFRFVARVEFTVQASPDVKPECVISVPQINLESAISLGNIEDSLGMSQDDLTMGASSSRKAMDIKLIESSLHIPSILGRLSQDQYKALLRRADQMLPLLPVLQKLNGSVKSVEKPDTPFVFTMRLDKGECCLCVETEGENGAAIKPLAGLTFSDFQVGVENTAERNLVKMFLDKVAVDALPNPPHSSKLYNPNAFISTSASTPLIVVRLKRSVHPPAELLIEEEAAEHIALKAVSALRNMTSNRAYWDGDRGRVDIIINGLRSAFNPNPACQILNFFLKSELNVSRMIATLQEAKSSLESSLESVDIEQALSGHLSRISEELVIDIDINVDIQDSRIYFVRDHDEQSGRGVPSGNIEFGLQQLLIDRHAEGKYSHKSRFALKEVSLVCNKEEENKEINTEPVYTPVSVHLDSDKHWDLEKKEWVLSTTGGMDKVDIAINPSHSNVFMNVLHGIKMKNIQDVVDSVSEYFGQIKNIDLTSKPMSPEELEKFNPVKEKVEQLKAQVAMANATIEIAAKEAAANQPTAQPAPTAASVLANADRKGFLNNLEGKQWAKRYCVLGCGMFLLFDSDACGKLLAKLTCTEALKLQMVQSVKNCFQLSNERKLVLAGNDEMDMTQWVNLLLRAQVAGKSEGAPGALGNLQKDLTALNNTATELGSMLQEFTDQAAMMARIKKLEQENKEQAAKLKALEAK